MNNTNTNQRLLAVASVVGRDHLKLGKNNQDALAHWSHGDLFCAVVADGCGSSAHSETGAQLGARLLCNALALKLGRGERFEHASQVLEELRLEMLARLRPIALALAGSDDPRTLAGAVRDHLLFTLVGAVLGPFGTLLFSIGDGALALEAPANRTIESLPLGPFAGNEPPYLGYALLHERAHGFADQALRFQIAAQRDTACALALGTDGALELFAGSPPVLLLNDPALFNNPDALRRKLWLLAQGKSSDAPALRDDTTLVLVRPIHPAIGA
jgi:hypothetical protein